MKKYLSVLFSVLPAAAFAAESSEEPSMLEAVVPFAVIGLMIAILAPLVAKKKK